jgi:hypothetical protein
VSKELIEAKLNKKYDYFVTSAKTNQNVEEAFIAMTKNIVNSWVPIPPFYPAPQIIMNSKNKAEKTTFFGCLRRKKKTQDVDNDLNKF